MTGSSKKYGTDVVTFVLIYDETFSTSSSAVISILLKANHLYTSFVFHAITDRDNHIKVVKLDTALDGTSPFVLNL